MQSRSLEVAAACRVLIVDDHPVVRNGLRHALEASGQVSVLAEAGDGEGGYQAYKEMGPDVVIMDLSMPGIGGLEAIRRIVRYDAKARILVFTVHANPLFEQRAREAGALAYLTKDGDVGELLEALAVVATGRPWFRRPRRGTGGKRGGNRQVAGEAERVSGLTLREFDVFRLLAEGRNTAEVAELLNISVNTVGVHKTRIMHKLRISNSAQLALVAVRQGIVKV